jgi:hypothetical protein
VNWPSKDHAYRNAHTKALDSQEIARCAECGFLTGRSLPRPRKGPTGTAEAYCALQNNVICELAAWRNDSRLEGALVEGSRVLPQAAKHCPYPPSWPSQLTFDRLLEPFVTRQARPTRRLVDLPQQGRRQGNRDEDIHLIRI